MRKVFRVVRSVHNKSTSQHVKPESAEIGNPVFYDDIAYRIGDIEIHELDGFNVRFQKEVHIIGHWYHTIGSRIRCGCCFFTAHKLIQIEQVRTKVYGAFKRFIFTKNITEMVKYGSIG